MSNFARSGVANAKWAESLAHGHDTSYDTSPADSVVDEVNYLREFEVRMVEGEVDLKTRGDGMD